jgi:predicted nucleic acid-binding protein
LDGGWDADHSAASGLADCALVILARRYDTTRFISFDERRFRAVTPLQGGAFTILPADAD